MLCFLGVSCLLASGCAAVPADPDERAEFEQANDPLEPTNRAIFQFNQVLDKAVLKPVAQAYVEVVPDRGRMAVHNFLNNLRSPIILANDLLQGSADRAGITLSRFMINSTIGVAGLLDLAGTKPDLPFHDADVGQTLAIWGIGDGPYLMLPVIGPSNPRDAFGLGVEFFADPVDLYFDRHDLSALPWIQTGAEIVDTRAGLLDTLDSIERTALDFYATIRSVSRQRRDDFIRYRRATPTP